MLSAHGDEAERGAEYACQKCDRKIFLISRPQTTRHLIAWKHETVSMLKVRAHFQRHQLSDPAHEGSPWKCETIRVHKNVENCLYANLIWTRMLKVHTKVEKKTLRVQNAKKYSFWMCNWNAIWTKSTVNMQTWLAINVTRLFMDPRFANPR